MLFGAPAVLEPPKTQALGEGLRVLLAAEVRGLRLTQHAVGGAPNQDIAAVGARNGAAFARCELCTRSGARLAVTAVGRAEAFEDREVGRVTRGAVAYVELVAGCRCRVPFSYVEKVGETTQINEHHESCRSMSSA